LNFQILTEILREKSDNTNDFLVVVYKQRADDHYDLRHFQGEFDILYLLRLFAGF
jgi:hypothetical protein